MWVEDEGPRHDWRLPAAKPEVRKSRPGAGPRRLSFLYRKQAVRVQANKRSRCSAFGLRRSERSAKRFARKGQSAWRKARGRIGPIRRIRPIGRLALCAMPFAAVGGPAAL